MTHTPPPSHGTSPPPPTKSPDIGKRLLIGLLVVVLAIVIAYIASAIIPRTWAQTIGRQAGGGMISGGGLGLFYGFTFTILALGILWLTFRRRRPWKLWVGGIVAAAVVASPNLATLSIVLGTGNAAHAGQRILDVEAPGFRAMTAVGAIVAGALFAFWRYQMAMRKRAQRRADRLGGEIGELRRQEETRQKAGPNPERNPAD